MCGSGGYFRSLFLSARSISRVFFLLAGFFVAVGRTFDLCLTIGGEIAELYLDDWRLNRGNFP